LNTDRTDIGAATMLSGKGENPSRNQEQRRLYVKRWIRWSWRRERRFGRPERRQGR